MRIIEAETSLGFTLKLREDSFEYVRFDHKVKAELAPKDTLKAAQSELDRIIEEWTDQKLEKLERKGFISA